MTRSREESAARYRVIRQMGIDLHRALTGRTLTTRAADDAIHHYRHGTPTTSAAETWLNGALDWLDALYDARDDAYLADLD